MNTVAAETLSVVVERDMPHPPDKVWRALTQPHLIDEWLMKTDFKPTVDHRFTLRADWGTVDCQVTAIEPNKSLSYRWDALGIETVVTWTLTPTPCSGASATPARPSPLALKPRTSSTLMVMMNVPGSW